MDQKIIKIILIVTLVFTFISAGNNIPHLKEVRGIQIARLLTFGIGIGASLVTIIMLILSKKSLTVKTPPI